LVIGLPVLLASVFMAPLRAQTAPSIDLEHRPATTTDAPPTVALEVPKGTPLEITLDSEVRVKRVGQTITGRIVEPVYAFDQLEIPAGAQAIGHITSIVGVSAGRRTEAVLNADFTPERKIEITFDQIVLPDGRHVAVQTKVTPGSGQLLDFVSAAEKAVPKGGIGGEAVTETHEAKQRARREWNVVMSEVKSPGKIHRLERYGLAQSPVHPQFIDAGSVYFAELQAPLDFGTEALTPEMARSIGDVSPSGGVVHARLEMGLTSATNRKGDAVNALITQPLFDHGRLIVPQGSVLTGSVVQVHPARRMSKNGELRVAFHQLKLPDGVEQAVEANLETVEAGKSADVKLDSEGGAQATTPKTRYLSTAVEIGLAGLSMRDDPDAKTPNPAGNTGNRMAGGVAGFKLVGTVLGIFVHSRAFGTSMGAYGAGMSIYTHFVARGRDVVFPKDTAMQIGLGTHDANPGVHPISNPNGN
jgi:hypothetical protein